MLKLVFQSLKQYLNSGVEIMGKIREIYSNYDLCETYPDEDMVELALENGMIECEEDITDSMIDDLRYDADAIEWETVWRELCNFFKNKEVIFFGTLGLWNGRHAGGQTGKFERLFNEAVRDCDYLHFYEENGHLFLECSHHDGTNYFEIKEITEKGQQYLENWEYSYKDKRSKQDIHERIVKNYSKRPQFCKFTYDI